MSVIETNIEIPADYSVSVFGQFDEYVKKIEKTLKVTIIARDSQVKILGSESGAGHKDIDFSLGISPYFQAGST